MPYRIRKWDDFQHYRDRSPPWIKLHRQLLDNREWAALSGDASKMLVECWLIASEGKIPGVIDMTEVDIAWRLRRPVEMVERWLQELVMHDFIEAITDDASAALAVRKQDARLETETEREKEAEATREDDGRAAAIVDMSTDLNIEIERVPQPMRPRLRAASAPLIDGTDRIAWLHPKSGGADAIPWADRPAIFRLALLDCISEGITNQRGLAGKVKYHAMVQLDPLPAKRPPAGSQAREHETPRGSNDLQRRLADERKEQNDLNAWKASHADDLASMQHAIAVENGVEKWEDLDTFTKVAATGKLHTMIRQRLASVA
jgi:hypothetical protein